MDRRKNDDLPLPSEARTVPPLVPNEAPVKPSLILFTALSTPVPFAPGGVPSSILDPAAAIPASSMTEESAEPERFTLLDGLRSAGGGVRCRSVVEGRLRGALESIETCEARRLSANGGLEG